MEIGPGVEIDPRVTSSWPELTDGAIETTNLPPVVLASLKRPSGDVPQSRCAFVEAAARAYEAGLTLDLAGLFAGEKRRRISLPGYPFQQRRHWFKESS